MPAERLSMRKVREVLRLKHALGMSYRKISEATGAGKTQAAEYVRRAQAAGIGWPIPDGIDDTELERRLFPVAEDSANKRPAGDWPAIQRELKRRGVKFIGPEAGMLACGYEGLGRLWPVEAIAERALKLLR